MQISKQVRQDIIRYLRLAQIALPSGEDGLALWDGIFDLSKLPSTDSRFPDAYADAWQHTVNNYDWEPDWVLADRRVDLLDIDDRKFCLFVEAIVNSDSERPAAQAQVVTKLNSVLVPRGLRLAVRKSLGEFSDYHLAAEKAVTTNQGRAHSANVAGLQYDSLLFRSQHEIALYTLLKNKGYVFAPLPVFITPRRIEPDFVILRKGRLFVVEVDGEFTHQETPVRAQERLRGLELQGAFVIRVQASERQKASDWATEAMEIIEEAIRHRVEIR